MKPHYRIEQTFTKVFLSEANPNAMLTELDVIDSWSHQELPVDKLIMEVPHEITFVTVVEA